jgi:hypothetical protein
MAGRGKAPAVAATAAAAPNRPRRVGAIGAWSGILGLLPPWSGPACCGGDRAFPAFANVDRFRSRMQRPGRRGTCILLQPSPKGATTPAAPRSATRGNAQHRDRSLGGFKFRPTVGAQDRKGLPVPFAASVDVRNAGNWHDRGAQGSVSACGPYADPRVWSCAEGTTRDAPTVTGAWLSASPAGSPPMRNSSAPATGGELDRHPRLARRPRPGPAHDALSVALVRMVFAARAEADGTPEA